MTLSEIDRLSSPCRISASGWALDRPTTTANLDAGSDWPKMTPDFLTVDGKRHVETVEELRASIEHCGDTVEHFKTLDAYRLPLNSGNYPWLAEL